MLKTFPVVNGNVLLRNRYGELTEDPVLLTIQIGDVKTLNVLNEVEQCHEHLLSNVDSLLASAAQTGDLKMMQALRGVEGMSEKFQDSKIVSQMVSVAADHGHHEMVFDILRNLDETTFEQVKADKPAVVKSFEEHEGLSRALNSLELFPTDVDNVIVEYARTWTTAFDAVNAGNDGGGDGADEDGGSPSSKSSNRKNSLQNRK